MRDIYERFKTFGVSEVETSVYVDLIQHPNSNGSQVAKRLQLTKPSVYLAIEKLFERGFIELLQGKSKEYIAKSPELVFNRLKEEVVEHSKWLIQSLEQLEEKSKYKDFIRIKGYKNFVYKVKEMLQSAKKEVCINTNYDLRIFDKEFRALLKKGIRIIVYSFAEQKVEYGQVYYNIAPVQGQAEEAIETKNLLSETLPSELPSRRLILVTDLQASLMSCGTIDENYMGTYTEDLLQVTMLSEHIHQDIYKVLIKEKLGKDPYDAFRLKSLLEDKKNDSGYTV